MERAGMRRTFRNANKFVVATLFVMGVFSASLIAFGDETREWVDSTGKHKIKAALVSQTDDKVKLRREDGRMIEMPIDKLSAKDRAFLEGDSDASPETDAEQSKKASNKESSSAPGGFAISGNRASAVGFPDEVYVGDSKSARELIKADIGMQWRYRPQTINAREKTVNRKFSLGKNDVLKGKESSSFSGFAVDPSDPNAPIYVSLNASGGANESYFARCDLESGDVAVAVLPFRGATLTDVSPDGNYALFIVNRTEMGKMSKCYLAITPLTDFGGANETVDSVIFDPNSAANLFGGLTDAPQLEKPNSNFNNRTLSNDLDPLTSEIMNDPEAMEARRQARKKRLEEQTAAWRKEMKEKSKAREEHVKAMFGQTTQSSFGSTGFRRLEPDFGEIYEAYWIDSSKILIRTKYEVTLWNLSTCKAIYRLETSDAALNVDPERKAFVLATPHAVSVYGVDDGGPLGRIPLSSYGETKDPDFTHVDVSATFSPSGRKLAVFSGSHVDVVDLAKGVKTRSLSAKKDEKEKTPFVETTPTGSAWGSDDYLIVNSIGYDLGSGEPVCSYSGLGRLGRANGQVWTLADNMTLVGFAAPHSAARVAIQDRKEKKAKEDPYVLHPGDSLAIRCELNKFHDEKRVERTLKEKLEKAGFRYDPSSKNVLVAKTVDTGETSDESYGEVKSNRAFSGGARLPGMNVGVGEKFERKVTVTVNIYEQSLAIEQNGKTIWAWKERTTGAEDAASDPDKSLEEQIRKMNKPEFEFFVYTALPKNVEREKRRETVEVKPTVNARLTSAGLL